MGIDLRAAARSARARWPRRAALADGNPGLELGLSLGEGWREGRDKVCINPTPGGFGLWVEQLARRVDRQGGQGARPGPGESADGPDRQAQEVRVSDPYELGQEFFRWEFAIAVAGSILGINPFDQPDVQAAKDKTNEVLASGDEPTVEPGGSLEELLRRRERRRLRRIPASSTRPRQRARSSLELADRAREATGCVVTHGFGPRYLHSTGQLHKGGPNTGLFLQVVDDTGEELPIPGRAVRLRPADPRAGGGRLRVALASAAAASRASAWRTSRCNSE